MTEIQIVRLEELEEQYGNLLGELSRLEEDVQEHYEYLKEKRFTHSWERETEIVKQMTSYANKEEEIRDEIEEIEKEIIKLAPNYFN